MVGMVCLPAAGIPTNGCAVPVNSALYRAFQVKDPERRGAQAGRKAAGDTEGPVRVPRSSAESPRCWNRCSSPGCILGGLDLPSLVWAGIG